MIPLMLAGLLLACQTESPTARQVDALVDALDADDAASTNRSCEAITDADLSDQCQIESVRRHATHDPHACQALQSPAWRDECLFLVAENAVAAGDTSPARQLCAGAGEYQDQCVGHLLTARMRAALKTCAHPVDCMSRDRTLVDELASAPGVGPREAWADYFQQGLHDGPDVTLSACVQATTEADRVICEDAVRAYVFRVTLFALTGPDSTPAERQTWCKDDAIPAVRAVGWFDHTDASLVITEQQALRFACLPAPARDAIPLGWNRLFEATPQVREAIAADDPRRCESLHAMLQQRRCRDAVYARRYQAACKGAPAACMDRARPIVAEAAAWPAGIADPLAREWAAFFFQHTWRQRPFLDCAKADSPSRCAAATQQAADRLVVRSLHDYSISSAERARLCTQGKPAIRQRLPMLDGVPIESGVALACAPDASPRFWPWDPSYRDLPTTHPRRRLRPPSH